MGRAVNLEATETTWTEPRILARPGVRGPFDLLYDLAASSRFRVCTDAIAEHRKLNFIRVLVGVLIAVRTGQIAFASLDISPPDHSFAGIDFSGQTLAAFAILGLTILFTVGILTPLITASLVVSYIEFDLSAGTYTLGSLVLMSVLIYLLLSNTGRNYAIDSWVIRRGSPKPIAAALRRLYSVLGDADERRLTVHAFMLFVAYAALSFSAVLVHIGTRQWRSGEAVGLLLVSSYFSRIYGPMRWLQEHAPAAAHINSLFATVTQTLWELLMVPLMWFRVGYWFVLLWGVAFISFSALLIQLSYLPWIELCLWALLFVPAPARDLVLVVYDDRCNLCRRVIATLGFLNVRKTYELQGLSRSQDVLEELQIDTTTVQRNIHGIFRGKVYVGYALYELMARRNPILWPLFPLLAIGRWLRIGPALYGAFARNRHRMFGTCELTLPSPEPDLHEARTPRIASFLTVAWTIALITFVLEIPQLRGQLTKIGAPREVLLDQWILSADRHVGLQQPNVFNEADLRAGDVWPVVYRLGPKHPGTLVPFNAPDGHRLAYHRNDIIYYGISLAWRVGAERADKVALHRRGGREFELLTKLMRYDKKRLGIEGPETYRVKIFRTRVSNSTIHDTDARFAQTLIDTYSTKIR